MLSFTIGKCSIALFFEGAFYTIDQSHLNYMTILDELKKPAADRDHDTIRDNLTMKKMVEIASAGHVAIFEDSIEYAGVEVNNYMTNRMLDLVARGFDISPWARFMDNVYLNPAEYAREELFEWMEKADMPITDDGCFLAFKKVREDFTDCHTGKFDNSPGSVLEMDRALCDTRRSNHCSTGFHFCSMGYLGSFGGSRIVIVKVHPQDVTSIPDDYNFTKGRCCRYEVVGELTQKTKAYSKAWAKAGVVNLENPQEFPTELTAMIEIPTPAIDEPAQPGASPFPTEEQIELAAQKIEEDATDAGKATIVTSLDDVPADDLVLKFETKDGGVFTAPEIEKVVADNSKREAARKLGIAESTLRGWLKKLGL